MKICDKHIYKQLRSAASALNNSEMLDYLLSSCIRNAWHVKHLFNHLIVFEYASIYTILFNLIKVFFVIADNASVKAEITHTGKHHFI